MTLWYFAKVQILKIKVVLSLPFQAPYVLPSNFEEVATGVLKFLNNLAYLDIASMQKMLVSVPCPL